MLLAIETSCDETSVALVRDGCELLGDLTFSQIRSHKKYGGVVPELASRAHQQNIIPVIDTALKHAKINKNQLFSS